MNTADGAPKHDPLAELAVAPITAGMVVGLGTGRAASRGVRALAERVRREGLRVRGVATSRATEELGRSLGLEVIELGAASRVDYLFDGADEVDPELAMIKGGGGAMTRERLVAHVCRASSGRCVYLIDASKLSPRLGSARMLPVEVLPMSAGYVRSTLEQMGMPGQIRGGDTPAVTDNGGWIIDVHLPAHGAERPRLGQIADRIKGLSGVIDHGLFLIEADELLIEHPDGSVSRRGRGG